MAEKSRTKKTLINFFVSTISMILTSTLGLYVSSLVLRTCGPDYFGLNATIIQILVVLQIIEAGFSIAVNVALYKPVVEGDQEKINAIYYIAKKIFRKIGILFLIISLLSSVAIPLFIKTEISYIEVVVLFLFAAIPTGISMYIALKYNCIYSANQREYIPLLLGIISQVLIGIASIVIVHMNLGDLKYLCLRGMNMLISLALVIVCIIVFRKVFPNVKPKKIDNMPVIKGTKDVIISKIAGALYAALPVILIAVFIDTITAGIFGVYMIVINIIKTALNTAVSAPANGFGQLISRGDKDYLYKQYYKFNLIVVILATLLLSVTLTLILPFVSIYTRGSEGVHYVNLYIAIMLVVVTFVNFSHIPAGVIMYNAGFFRAGRNICILTTLVIIVLGTVGIIAFGLYGLLAAMLICAVLLALCEVLFTYKRIFPRKLPRFCLMVAINAFIFISLYFVWHFAGIGQYIHDILTFILWGGVVFTGNAIVIGLINFVVFNKEIKDLIMQFKGIVNFRRRKSSR